MPAATDDNLLDIGFASGRIKAIEPRIEADAPVHDAAGCLCCGGLIETHIHLDKSRIVDRCAPELSRSQPDHMRRVQAVKSTFTVEDIYTRAKETLEACITHGATRIRTHVEIDEPVGVKGVEALLQLAKEYAWAVDLELCVFPQEGLTNAPTSDGALIRGLEMGARVIGAAPNYDVDHPGQIKRIFELARRFDVDIDMHIDSGHDPTSLDTHLVVDLTERMKLGGRVAVGHMTKLAGLPPARQKEIARRLAGVGVAVTVLPSTDLFVLARHVDHNVPRCVADAGLFVEEGCNCSISSNNILNNVFTPFGDASLIRMANLHANILQVGQSERKAELFTMISDRSARLMNLGDYGLKVGNPADLVIIDASTPPWRSPRSRRCWPCSNGVARPSIARALGSFIRPEKQPAFTEIRATVNRRGIFTLDRRAIETPRVDDLVRSAAAEGFDAGSGADQRVGRWPMHKNGCTWDFGETMSCAVILRG